MSTLTASRRVTWVRRPDRTAVAIAAVVIAAFAAYALVWIRVTPFEIGRSDFTATYVGGTLLRSGAGSRVYDEALQAPLHSALIAPDLEGNLPFVDSPPAAVLAAPLTVLPLATAYRAWALIQVLLVVAAALIAAAAAPWPASVPTGRRRLIALAAAAGVGTGVLLLQGQWDGVNSLSIALAYSAWRHRRPGWAGAALAIGAGVAKPHLALGLAAFLLARRKRAELVGAVAGTAGIIVVSLLAVGPSGLRGFVEQLMTSAGRWHQAGFLSTMGLSGSLFGDTSVAQAVGVALGVAVLAVGAWIASRTRARDDLLEPALAVAVLASLLASPHLLEHDVVLLAPAMVWCAAAAQRQGWWRAIGRLQPEQLVLTGWLLVNLVLWTQIGSDAAGAIVPWLWLALGAACAVATRAHRRPDDRDHAQAPSSTAVAATGNDHSCR